MLKLKVIFFLISVEIISTCAEDIYYSVDFDNSIESHDILEDGFLTAPDLIKKYGYPSETHTVVTKDGYHLEMHRIRRDGSQPVLLLHGLLDSSSTWVMMGPERGLGYLLYEKGYDVWMGNVRGNRYSRKHQKYSAKSRYFWDFSFHEIGVIDTPTMVDYVLTTTNFTQLHYVGHSQGTTVFWVMCSELPEYNKKILSMQAMAPISYIGDSRSPLTLFFSVFAHSYKLITSLIGNHEFLPSSDLIHLIGSTFCKKENLPQAVCSNIIFFVVGFNKAEFNSTMLPVILGHTPAGASSKQIIHFAQLKRSGKFRQFDHGIVKNLLEYKSINPPKYDLGKVTAKVALYYSPNDWMVSPKDIEKLHQELPNPIGKFLVKDRNYNHLDFVWGIHAREYLYEPIMKMLELVEKGFA